MARCEVCGNDYDKSFEVVAGDERHTFDSFECAIHRMAPECQHCRCKVVGHGTEVDGRFFCCAHCAREGAGTAAGDDPSGPDQEKLDELGERIDQARSKLDDADPTGTGGDDNGDDDHSDGDDDDGDGDGGGEDDDSDDEDGDGDGDGGGEDDDDGDGDGGGEDDDDDGDGGGEDDDSDDDDQSGDGGAEPTSGHKGGQEPADDKVAPPG